MNINILTKYTIKYTLKLISLLITCYLLLPSTPLQALTVTQFNQFLYDHRISQPDSTLALTELTFTVTPSADPSSRSESPLSSTPISDLPDNPFILKRAPLVSPNPLPLSQGGGQFGFGFSGHGSLNVLFFDIRGNLLLNHPILDTDLSSRSIIVNLDDYQGSFYQFNLDLETFPSANLPSGAYFFLLIQDQTVLSKGSFTVVSS